jgi:hypothetical protein
MAYQQKQKRKPKFRKMYTLGKKPLFREHLELRKGMCSIDCRVTMPYQQKPRSWPTEKMYSIGKKP